MLLNPIYSYPALSRTTNPDGSRFYICPETGEPLPSVTTVISATSSKKESLREWEEWVGAAKADRTRQEATVLGTLVHSHIENHIQSIDRPKGNMPIRVLAHKMADVVIEKGLSRLKEAHGIEVALAMPGMFAGTCDLVAVTNEGEQVIVDFKTAKKMRSLKMIEDDYGDQMAAYRLAHDTVYGTNIKRGIIMMVSRDLEFEAFEFGNLERRSEQFIDRLVTYLNTMTGG